MKRIIFFLGLTILLAPGVFARENLRELFKNNAAIIYTINIRNFSAIDKNLDGIINTDDGDIKGTFTGAIDKLKILKRDEINTIYLLPITPTGKLKALGTAGSLYAMDSFSEINPQLDDLTNDLSVFDEAKEFIKKAHELDMYVIVDLPSCGSYDLSLKKPDWFITDDNKQPYTPADWTDVRLFSENKAVIDNFKSFVDMMINLEVDGIRADVAAIRTPGFWKEIISYARNKNKDFFFLAEASPDWSNPANNVIAHYSSIDELLDAGFDSYYGSWSDFKNITTKDEFDLRMDKNLKIIKKHPNSSMISAIATHDQQAPVLRGVNYWNMVLWLSTTLPLNTYFLDGFNTGDDYTYKYENKKAQKTYTDDEYYFVHSGMFDIFNFSAPVKLKYPRLITTYQKAIDFKNGNQDLITNGTYKSLKTGNDKVFAYSIINSDRELIVIGSLDDSQIQKACVKSKYLNEDYLFSLINTKIHPKTEKDVIHATLEPLEIQVYLVSLAKFRAM